LVEIYACKTWFTIQGGGGRKKITQYLRKSFAQNKRTCVTLRTQNGKIEGRQIAEFERLYNRQNIRMILKTKRLKWVGYVWWGDGIEYEIS